MKCNVCYILFYSCFIFFFGGSTLLLSGLFRSRDWPGAIDLPIADGEVPRSFGVGRLSPSLSNPWSLRISVAELKLPVLLARSRALIWDSRWEFWRFRSSRSVWLIEFFRRIYCEVKYSIGQWNQKREQKTLTISCFGAYGKLGLDIFTDFVEKINKNNWKSQ